jgi:hypothetical protein
LIFFVACDIEVVNCVTTHRLLDFRRIITFKGNRRGAGEEQNPFAELVASNYKDNSFNSAPKNVNIAPGICHIDVSFSIKPD